MNMNVYNTMNDRDQLYADLLLEIVQELRLLTRSMVEIAQD